MSIRLSYEFEDYHLDVERMALSRQGNEIRLEPQVYNLLRLLVVNHDRIVSREEIHSAVWQGRHVSDTALSSRLRSVRTALGDDGSAQRLIKTIPNQGIRFVGDVRVIEAEANNDAPAWRKALVRHRLSILLATALIASIASLAYSRVSDLGLREQFVLTERAAIRWHNDRRLIRVSVEECMRACIDEPDFVCRSFDYYVYETRCDLSLATGETAGGLKTDYPGDPFDHYARILPEE